MNLHANLLISILFSTIFLYSQDYRITLYSGEIPNSIKTCSLEKIEKKDILRLSNVQNPDIAVYLPTKRFATGQAVVICPGGGYWIQAYDLEGTDIAKYLNLIGVAVFGQAKQEIIFVILWFTKGLQLMDPINWKTLSFIGFIGKRTHDTTPINPKTKPSFI